MLHLIAQAATTQPTLTDDPWAARMFALAALLMAVLAWWKTARTGETVAEVKGRTDAQDKMLDRLASGLHTAQATVAQVAQQVTPVPPAVVTITPPPPTTPPDKTE